MPLSKDFTMAAQVCLAGYTLFALMLPKNEPVLDGPGRELSSTQYRVATQSLEAALHELNDVKNILSE